MHLNKKAIFNKTAVLACAAALFLLWTIKIASAASVISVGDVTPTSGASLPNAAVTFTATYSNSGIWWDVKYVAILINSANYSGNCFYGRYDPKTNKLYLVNDAGASLLGGFKPGSSNVIENSYAKLNCAQTTVSYSGSALTIKWNVTFKSAFKGAKGVYLYADGAEGVWKQKGIWLVGTNLAPSVGGVTPSSGSSSDNIVVKFAAVYSDSNGWRDIRLANLLISAGKVLQNCFNAYYDSISNRLYLYDDAGVSALGGFAPGSNNIVENSYTKLDCAKTTVSFSGAALTVNWAVVSKPTFYGEKKLYLCAKDGSGASCGWMEKGTWKIVSSNLAPSVGSLIPSSGSSQPNTPVRFTATYSDSNGWQNIKVVEVLINEVQSIINFKNGLFARYDQNSNKLYLRNDANTIWLGGFAPGSNSIIENSYAKIDCKQTAVLGSGDTLTIDWNVIFKPAFAGDQDKVIFLYAEDDLGESSFYKVKGAWKVCFPDTAAPVISITEPKDGAVIAD